MATTTRTRTRIVLTLLASAALFSAAPLPAQDTPTTVRASAATVTRPTVVYVSEATAEQRALTEWAVDRYVTAGLQLPDFSIEFRIAGCHRRGQYSRTTRTITLCDGRDLTLLHELAHAWDQFADIDRDGFVALRGLEHYWGGGEVPWNQKGAEHLADFVAWALMEDDTSVPAAEYPSQPADEYEHRLPRIPNSSIPEILEALDHIGVAPQFEPNLG